MDFVLLFSAGVILFFSTEAMLAAYTAAQVFSQKVLPALLPMMVLGGMMSRKTAAEELRTSDAVLQILFAFCAGSPASFRRLAGMRLPLRAYRILLCICGVMSPMFFTGTLAALMGTRAGWVLLFCHWGSALLTGCLCMAVTKGRSRYASSGHAKSSPVARTDDGKSPSFAAALCESIRQAMVSLLAVLGAMMCFAILAAVLQGTVQRSFPRWAANNSLLLAVCWAVLEIGGGMAALLQQCPTLPLWAVCTLCSFGGLSIWLQNLLFLNKEIHPAELLAWRVLHGGMAGLLCYAFCAFIGDAASAAIQAAQPYAGKAVRLLPFLLLIPVCLRRRGHRSS